MEKYILMVGRIRPGSNTLEERVLVGRMLAQDGSSNEERSVQIRPHFLHRQYPNSYDESGDPIPL